MKEKLNEWLQKNIPSDDLIYRDGLYEQCDFVRRINNIFLTIATDYESIEDFNERMKIRDNYTPYVIGAHVSKSVRLPVIEIDLSKIGIKIVIRDNFYDWCISVESEKDINCDFKGLITDDKGYFEGFPEDRIYKKYSETNRKNFSFCLGDKYQVYTCMFLLKDYIMNMNNK